MSLNHPKRKSGSRWTPEEDAYLEEHYPTTQNSEIGAVLNRKAQAVASRAQQLGISKAKESIILSAAEQAAILAARRQRLTVTEIAEELAEARPKTSKSWGLAAKILIELAFLSAIQDFLDGQRRCLRFMLDDGRTEPTEFIY